MRPIRFCQSQKRGQITTTSVLHTMTEAFRAEVLILIRKTCGTSLAGKEAGQEEWRTYSTCSLMFLASASPEKNKQEERTFMLRWLSAKRIWAQIGLLSTKCWM